VRGRAASFVLTLALAAAAAPSPAAAQVRARAHVDDVRRTAIVTAAARVAPAVVSVNVVRREQAQPSDVWEQFFLPRGYERTVKGLGSGFIISPNGIVITNQHVTDGAEQIVVTTRDGTDYPAKLLGEDPLTDIAVLKIDGHDLPTAPIGSSRDLEIGEWAIAIGNPYGYLLGNSEPTVTAGVISGVDRNLLPSSDQSGIYVGMIQTDAAINPGNSGGPLVDALGEVIGVNSSILSSSGGSIGLGFAIPIERALRVAHELEAHGTVRRAWVGLGIAPTTTPREWKRIGGIEVQGVAPGSPAARSGIVARDVLADANGHALHTFLDWESVKLDVAPGDTIVVHYTHDGARHRAVLNVEDLPSTRAEKVSVLGGIRLITVTPQIRQERGIHHQRGALIYQIPSATSQQTGLAAGDVIVQINRTPITNAEQVRRAFTAAANQGAVRVYFERSGQLAYADFYVR